MFNSIRKFFDEFSVGFELQELYNWVTTLSERSLMLTAITVFHCIFTPQLIAFLNDASAKMPSLDSYLLLVGGLGVMSLRSVLVNDKISTLVHLAGFISQLVIICMVFMK